MADLPVYIMSGVGLVGVIAIIVWMGFLTQNKDNAAEIQKNLGIVGSVSAILIAIFGVVSYIYFTANPGYIPFFVLIMTFVNLFISVFALSAASLSVVSS